MTNQSNIVAQGRFEQLDEATYQAAKNEFINQGQDKWNVFAVLMFNALERYQEHTNVEYLNDMVMMAKAHRYMIHAKKLIDEIRFHTFDKDTGLFKQGKPNKDKLTLVRKNWEFLFDAWFDGIDLSERKAATFNPEARFQSFINQLKEKAGMNDKEVVEFMQKHIASIQEGMLEA